MLDPVLFFVVTYGFISALQVFDMPWLLTGSSFTELWRTPDALLFPVMDMMGRGFRQRSGSAQAAAYGFILTVDHRARYRRHVRTAPLERMTA